VDKQSLYLAIKFLLESSRFIANVELDEIYNQVIDIADNLCTILEKESGTNENVSFDHKDPDVSKYIDILSKELNIEPKDITDIYESAKDYILSDSIVLENNSNNTDIRQLTNIDISDTLLQIQKEVRLEIEKEKKLDGSNI
jgi:hypothetical protein